MAYGLKYTTYKVVGDTRYTLRIYQKDYNGASFGIGTLTGFSLQIQGDQSSLIAPIIKTSVNISLKDFFNRGTTQSGVTCIEDGEKMGQWEEFYTRDPLKYRIDVLVGASNPTTIWSGYLTPDSWGEEMQYGGDINLTARDMLGYLDEQEFDLTGRTTIQNLIQSAITKSQSAMAVAFKTTDCLYNSNGQSILASTIDASTFSGNTWYQALEKTLESLGLVLRYDGQGGFLVTSLRYQISYTHEYSTAVFTDRSGYRTLDPAVKQIVETFDPSIEPYIPADPAAESYTSNGATITQYITTEPISGGGSVQPPSHITNTFSGYTLAMPASGKGFAGQLAQPKLRTPKYGAPDRGMYLPTDVTSGQTAYYANPELKSPFILQFGLEGECLCEYGTALGPDLTPINIYKPVANDESHHSLSKIIIQVTARIGSVNYYLSADKAWEVGNSGVNIELAKDEELAVPLLDGGVDFNITIVKLETSHKNFNERTISNLVAPLLMTVSPAESHDLAGEYKTTTIYNTINRVEINRGPSIGSATCTRMSLPMVKNILGYGNDIATDAWKFYGDNATFPLAVMIHAQIIVYYGQMEDSQGRETGNSIFTGNFIDSEQTPLVPATRYTYFGKTCTLLSGAYNFLTGGVDSATLREFFTWSSVWDTFDPTYSVKTSRNEGGTASAGGGGSASGGGGSTGGSVTSVDMSVPTGMTIGGNPITTRGTLALGLAEGYNFLTDSYKATLDGHLGSSSNPHNVTLAQAAGQSLADKLTALASWFEYDENNHAIRVKEYIGESQVKTSFYAYGEVTAGGIGSGGGGGGAAIWGAITGTLSNQTDLMAALNGKASASHTHTIANISDLQSDLNTIGSALQSLQSQTDSVGSRVMGVEQTLEDTQRRFGFHETDTTIHITASERANWNAAYTHATTTNANPHQTTFAQLASHPTTISDYGITDAYTKSEVYTKTEVNGKLITAVSLTTSKLTLTRSDGNLEANIPTWNQDTTGNAATATKLATARNIWGQSFDGSAAISGNMSGVGKMTFTSVGTTPSASGNVLEVVTINGVPMLHSVLPIYSDGEITAGGVGSGGGGSTSALYSCVDVYHSGTNILRANGTARQDGDLLAYNSTQGKWVAMVAPATGVTSISVNGGAAQTGAVALTIPSAYTLPIASASVLGGVKVGTNLSIDASGVLSSSDTHDTNTAGTGIAVSGTRGSTIAIHSTYLGYIANGQAAYDAQTIVSAALQSLQSQIDSVASKVSIDEFVGAVVSTELLTATSAHIGTIEGNLTGNVTGNVTGSLYGNASSATNADTLDGIHASGLFSAVSSSGATNLSVTIGGTTRTTALYATYDSASENIADKMTTISSALQSLQSQVDSVGSRDFAEIRETLMGLKMWIEDMFEKTSSGIHAKYSLYSNGEITAGA